MWGHVHLPNPINCDPSLHGWQRNKNGSLAMKWFAVSQMPHNLQVDIVNEDKFSCGYDSDDKMEKRYETDESNLEVICE